MKTILVMTFLWCAAAVSLHAQSITVTITFDPTSGIVTSGTGAEIQLTSFKIGAVQPGLANYAGSGASASKSQFTPLTLYKNIDSTTPQLFLDCALGKLIKTAKLTVYQDSTVLFQIVLTKVFISAINDDSTYSDGGPPIETFALSYGQIGWQYTAQGAPPVNGGFDVQKNVKITWSQLVNQVTPGPQ